MIRFNIIKVKGTIKRLNTTVQGETIEQKVSRIVNNKEPIKDGAPLLYTERKDGVIAAHDVRTDRWEIAREATDKIAKSKLAKRDEYLKKSDEGQKGTEPIQGTGQNQSA